MTNDAKDALARAYNATLSDPEVRTKDDAADRIIHALALAGFAIVPDRRTQSLIGTLETVQSFLNVGIYSDENVQVLKRLVEIALGEARST